MLDVLGVSAAVASPEATYGFTRRDGPSVEDVQLTVVTAHGWRVSDGRLPLGDPLRLLAFVEERRGVFEVMQLGADFHWHEFESLEEALAFVIETCPRVAQERLSGELAWLR